MINTIRDLEEYGDAEGGEGRNGAVEDVPAAAHDGDGGAVLAELGGDLEADAGAAAGEQSYLACEGVGVERRLHRCGDCRKQRE